MLVYDTKILRLYIMKVYLVVYVCFADYIVQLLIYKKTKSHLRKIPKNHKPELKL